MAKINPWTPLTSADQASKIYKIEYPFDLIRFTTNLQEETLPTESQFQKVLKPEYCQFMDEKNQSPHLKLKTPFSVEPWTVPFYDQASTSFMCTLMESHEHCIYKWPKADIYVTAATLKLIGDSVLHPERQFKLRAFEEQNHFILCAENEDPENFKQPPLKRDAQTESLMRDLDSIMQQITEEKMNTSICGALFVLSTFRLGNESMSACVFGDVDMLTKDKAINIAQLKACERSGQLSFTDTDAVNECFEYIWPKSFWIGINQILFIPRQEKSYRVKTFQKMPLESITKVYNRRNSRLADQATLCVAKVLFEIRSMLNSNKNEKDKNILVTYEGAKNQEDDCPIVLKFCDDKYSFWLLRENCYLKKIHDKKEEAARKYRERHFKLYSI